MKFLRQHYSEAAAVVIVAAILFLVLTKSSYFWSKHHEIAVTRNGQLAPGSAVYFSRANIWLVKVPGDEHWYAFYPVESGMGVCSNVRQLVALPGFLLLSDQPHDMPCVRFSPVKAEEPHLIIRNEYLEFTSLNNERIRLIWRAAS